MNARLPKAAASLTDLAATWTGEAVVRGGVDSNDGFKGDSTLSDCRSWSLRRELNCLTARVSQSRCVRLEPISRLMHRKLPGRFSILAAVLLSGTNGSQNEH
jgi:hypothetical protein